MRGLCCVEHRANTHEYSQICTGIFRGKCLRQIPNVYLAGNEYFEPVTVAPANNIGINIPIFLEIWTDLFIGPAILTERSCKLV